MWLYVLLCFFVRNEYFIYSVHCDYAMLKNKQNWKIEIEHPHFGIEIKVRCGRGIRSTNIACLLTKPKNGQLNCDIFHESWEKYFIYWPKKAINITTHLIGAIATRKHFTCNGNSWAAEYITILCNYFPRAFSNQ